jgi:hypothetical protein
MPQAKSLPNELSRMVHLFTDASQKEVFEVAQSTICRHILLVCDRSKLLLS